MRYGVVAVLAAGAFDGSFEQAVSPALPRLREQLAASPTSITWVITGYVLAAAVAIPLAGPMGNRYGRRRILLASLAAFTIGAVVCALASDVSVLIAGRILQGTGAGVGVLGISIAVDNLAPGDVPRAVGFVVGGGALGGIVGLLVTGLLVDHVSVSAVFWVLAALAALTAVAAWRFVEESPIYTRERVDGLGAVLLGGTLATVMLAVSKGNDWGWSSVRVLGLLTGTVVLASAWVAWERRTTNPLIDLRSMRRRPIWSANLAVFGVGFAFFVPFTLVPLLAGYPKATGYGLGLGGTSIALLLMPGAVAVLVGAAVGGRAVTRLGARRQTLMGAGLVVLGYAGYVLLPRTAAALASAGIPLGLGIGLGICALLNLVVEVSSASETSVTTGLNVTARTVGAALGPQVAIAVAVAVPAAAPGLLAGRGFDHAFVFGLVAAIGAVFVACALPDAQRDPLLSRRNTRSRAPGVEASPPR